MSSETVISAKHVGKCYQIYERPSDRLKQFILPRAASLAGRIKGSYYRDFWALRDVSFDLKKGESLGVLGRNGSGKSTLLQIITGTLTPTSGSVSVNARVAALLELGAGFNPEFSGRENVYLGAALQGWSEAETKEKYHKIVEFADIGRFVEMPVKTYSSGMYARLAFAAAIHTDPELLIVDEILAVGDSAFQAKCLKRIYGMMDDGVSVLMVSHDAYQIRSICQKALVLNQGEQLFFGSAVRGMDEYVALMSEPVLDSTLAVHAEAGEKTGDGADETDSVDVPFFITIPRVSMDNMDGVPTDVLQSGDGVTLVFDYEIHGHYEGDLIFVVNLYREDGTYIFGTTTAMRGLAPYAAQRQGSVRVVFPTLPLVSGSYKWRVAVNDGRGLHIIAEAVPVCPFMVEDDFQAVGLVDIAHEWHATARQGA